VRQLKPETKDKLAKNIKRLSFFLDMDGTLHVEITTGSSCSIELIEHNSKTVRLGVVNFWDRMLVCWTRARSLGSYLMSWWLRGQVHG
jgi:hypothetical protein